MGKPLLLVEPVVGLLDPGGLRFTAWIAKATGHTASIVRDRIQVASLGQRASDVHPPTALLLAGRRVAEAIGLGILDEFRPILSNAGVKSWDPCPTYLIPVPSDTDPWWKDADKRERGLIFLRCVIEPKRKENREAAARVIELAARH